MKRFLTSVAASAALMCSSAFAATPVYDGSATGNQAYGDMLGNDFLANSAVWITQVGVFDDGKNGLTNSLQVGLYDVTAGYSAVISPVTFAAGTANAGGTQFIYQNVTPVQLTAGHVYSVQASGFNGFDLNYNTNVAGTNQGPANNSTTPITFNTLGGALSNRESRYGGTLGQAGTYFGNSSTFGAGTVAAVPEPETYAMLLAGLTALSLTARRRRDR